MDLRRMLVARDLRSVSSEMLRKSHFRPASTPERVPDYELGVAAVLVGLVVLLATVLVPIIG